MRTNNPKVHRVLLFRLAIAAAFLLTFVPSSLAADTHRILLAQPKPVFPEIARQMHLYGSLVLEITVLPDGHVGTVKQQTGHPMLLRAADDAVRRWRYSPAPETTTLTVQIDFLEPK